MCICNDSFLLYIVFLSTFTDLKYSLQWFCVHFIGYQEMFVLLLNIKDFFKHLERSNI